MSLIDKLIKNGNIPILHAYGSNSTFDWSKSGANGINLAKLFWNGRDLSFNGVDTVVNTVSLAGSFTHLQYSYRLSNKKFLSIKRLTNFEPVKIGFSGTGFFVSVTSSLGTDNNVVIAPLDLIENHEYNIDVCVDCSSTNDVKVYVNNVLKLTGSLINAANGTMTLGEYAIGHTSQAFQGSIETHFICNMALTQSQRTEVNAELQSLVWPTKTTYRGAYKSTVKAYDPSLVGGYEMRLQDGEIKDQSGNGNDGIITGTPPTEIDTPVGPGLNWVDGRATMGAGFQALNDVTVIGWFQFDDIIADQWIWNYYLSSVDAWGLRLNGGQIGIYDDIDDANLDRYLTPLVANKLYRIAVVMEALENKFYLNGILVGSGSSSSDDWSSFAGLLRSFDRSGSGANDFLGTSAGTLQVFNEAKSSDWVKQDYQDDRFLRGMRTAWMTQYGAHESSEAVTAGYLENTPFQIESGSHKVIVETAAPRAGMKAIEVVTSGLFYIQTSHFGQSQEDAAHGEFELWVNKTSTSNINIDFISDSLNNAALNGYRLLINSAEAMVVYLRTNGGLNTKAQTADGIFTPDVWNKINIVRTRTGVFRLFLNDSLVPTTIGSNPFTDSTHTISKYQRYDPDIGDKIAIADLKGDHAIVKTID